MTLDRLLARPTADIAYSDRGVGRPDVVLTHGAGVDHAMFEAQAASLAQRGVRVILWDLRGHGRSSIAQGTRFTARDALGDLDALLRACGTAAPVLVGHSLGGNLAQAFAQRHPDRVTGVVVLDATWNAGPLSRPERSALRLAAPILSLIPARALPHLMARASAQSPEAIALTEAAFARMPKRRFLEVWRATTSLVSPDPGFRSAVPIALIRGARDRTGNIAAAMRRWAAAEDIVERVIPDAGHMVTWDAPDAVSRVLIGVLRDWKLLPE
ncbi:alpha/beta fold hydrolase [Microbacterium sp. JZ31]|uniref:alpha/beta fold hydrolase n=1 Tax=Microbacterium sp. JZ31 TaxID=1906274 RepID=UPI001EE4997D|nr:alpha/beta hydrolase [Microbacterium sp. JZ31]